MSISQTTLKRYEGSNITYLIQPSNKLTVLSVCTNGSNPGLLNFKISLERLGYNYNILGLGQKWGGWSWRTKLYLSTLEKMEEQIVVLSDGTDVLFVEEATLLLERFKTMKTPIVIGAERGLTTGKYKYDLAARKAMRTSYREREPNRSYRFPNGGLIIGYRTSLMHLLYANKDSEDDQAGLVELYDKDQRWFTLDTECQLFGNLVQRASFFDEDLEISEENWWKVVWDLSKDTRRFNLINIETGKKPCVLHFAGGNWSMYNKLGPLIIGPIHQPMYPSGTEAVKSVVKQPWTSSLLWIVSIKQGT